MSTQLASEVTKSEELLQQVTSLKRIQSELREKITGQSTANNTRLSVLHYYCLIDEEITQLTQLVQIKQTNEIHLESRNYKLNEQVTSLQLTMEEERSTCKELSKAMEERVVLLKKTQAQVGNLNKKCKVS